jgi:hypothetical protein
VQGAVPALSREATSGQTPYEEAGRTSEADSTRDTFVALGITVFVIALLAAIVAKSAGWIVALVIVLGVIFYRLVFSGGHRETSAKDAAGRLVLRAGYTEPVSEAERSRELEEEITQYMSDGFFVRQRTATTAQLVRPKRFSFVWALLWFLVFGVGIIVYLIYYAAKQDEGRYVEVDEYGAIKATRQIRHVLYCNRTATGLELGRTEEENGKRRSAENRIKRQDLLTRQDAIGTLAAHL